MDDVARDAIYLAQINVMPRRVRKKKLVVALMQIDVLSALAASDHPRVAAVARVNLTATEVTYRKCIRSMAKLAGLAIEEFDLRTLQKLSARAFLPWRRTRITQMSPSSIYHCNPVGKDVPVQRTVALVGKGICFDIGGHIQSKACPLNGRHAREHDRLRSGSGAHAGGGLDAAASDPSSFCVA